MAVKTTNIGRSAATGRFVSKKKSESKVLGTVKTSARSTAIMDQATKKYRSALRNLAKK